MGVLVFATLGAYAAGGTTVDLVVPCGLGLLALLIPLLLPVARRRRRALSAG